MVTFQLPTVYGLVRTTPVAAEGRKNGKRRRIIGEEAWTSLETCVAHSVVVFVL